MHYQLTLERKIFPNLEMQIQDRSKDTPKKYSPEECLSRQRQSSGHQCSNFDETTHKKAPTLMNGQQNRQCRYRQTILKEK